MNGKRRDNWKSRRDSDRGGIVVLGANSAQVGIEGMRSYTYMFVLFGLKSDDEMKVGTKLIVPTFKALS